MDQKDFFFGDAVAEGELRRFCGDDGPAHRVLVGKRHFIRMTDYLECGDFKSERFMAACMFVVTSESGGFRYTSKTAPNRESLVQIPLGAWHQ